MSQPDPRSLSFVYDVLQRLEATSKSTEKLKILKAEQHNELLRVVMGITYNPYINFFQKSPDSVEAVQPDVTQVLGTLFDIWENPSRSEMKALLVRMSGLCSSIPTWLSVFSRMLRRDLECGVSTSTINKVWPGLIPTFSVMKAVEKVHLDKMPFPAMVQAKIDGSRCIVRVSEDGKVIIHSSSGRVYPHLEHIKEDVKSLLDDRVPSILDGELIGLLPDGTTLKRETGNGLCNRALHGSLDAHEETVLHLVLFDYLPGATDLSGCTLPARQRMRGLLSLVNASSPAHISCVLSNTAHSGVEAMRLFQEHIRNGSEGVVVKDPDALYVPKRSKAWVKLKKELELDLIIAGWTPHSKESGMVGAIEVASNNAQITGNVGTKLTDQQRRDMFDMAQDSTLVGRVCTIRIHDLTVRDGKLSLYLPRFIEFRDDKTEADSLRKIFDMTGWARRNS